jgi:uncharacterized protein Yka (UPF0111/DUF47 family)
MKIWRKNFEIKRCHYQMASQAAFDLMNYQHLTVGKMILKEMIWVQKGYDNVGSYFPKDQLRTYIEKILETMEKNPKLVRKLHKKNIQYCEEYFVYARRILGIDLKKRNDQQLTGIYNKLNYYQRIHHGYSISTTWFVDSDGEDFSRLLMKKAGEFLGNDKPKLSQAEVFSILTTPVKPSLAMLEEIESLKILDDVNKDQTAKKIFLEKDVKKIEKKLDKINPDLRRKILRHYKKWLWVPYTYMGPVYELDYYLEMWSGILRQKIDFHSQLKELEGRSNKTRKQKAEIVKRLKINAKTKELFEIASEIIYLKAFRKDAIFYGMFVLEKLHREIGKRLGLSLNQVRFMADWEVVPAIKKRYFSSEILNERIKFSVLYYKKIRELFILVIKLSNF